METVEKTKIGSFKITHEGLSRQKVSFTSNLSPDMAVQLLDAQRGAMLRAGNREGFSVTFGEHDNFITFMARLTHWYSTARSQRAFGASNQQESVQIKANGAFASVEGRYLTGTFIITVPKFTWVFKILGLLPLLAYGVFVVVYLQAFWTFWGFILVIWTIHWLKSVRDVFVKRERLRNLLLTIFQVI